MVDEVDVKLFKIIFQKNLKELFKYYFAHFLILLIAFS